MTDRLLEVLRNPPVCEKECSPSSCKKFFTPENTFDHCTDYEKWESQILTALKEDGWVKVDEVLARLPKKKQHSLEPYPMVCDGWNNAIDKCHEAIKQMGGAEVNKTGGKCD